MLHLIYLLAEDRQRCYQRLLKMQTLPKQLYIAYLNRPRLLITSNKKYFSFQLKLKLFFQTSNVSKIGSDVGVLRVAMR